MMTTHICGVELHCSTPGTWGDRSDHSEVIGRQHRYRSSGQAWLVRSLCGSGPLHPPRIRSMSPAERLAPICYTTVTICSAP